MLEPRQTNRTETKKPVAILEYARKKDLKVDSFVAHSHLFS